MSLYRPCSHCGANLDSVKSATVEVPPMLYLVTIAGAIQLTRWVLTLLDAIEKPPVPTPTKARHRGA